jgi:hypothetical protein
MDIGGPRTEGGALFCSPSSVVRRLPSVVCSGRSVNYIAEDGSGEGAVEIQTYNAFGS